MTRVSRYTAALIGIVLVLALMPQPVAGAVQMGAPTVLARLNGRVDVATVPLTVSWPAAPKIGSSVSRYSLQHSTGSAWAPVALPKALSRSVTIRVRPWQVHRFRVRATYANGTVTDWSTSNPPLWLAYADESDLAAAYGTGWTNQSDSKAHRGARSTATSSGASMTFTFTGRQLAWVSRYGPDRGRARVYVDDTLMATVDLRRTRVRHRRVAFRAAWSTSQTRTVRIEAEGTAGRPRVDVDAFLVLGEPRSETIVGAGDIGQCGREAPRLTGALVEAIGGIVYTTGDNAYPNGTAAELAECYDPAWGSFKARTRPSPGNHDYATSGAGPYYDYFGNNAGPNRRGWYTYQAGTWRVYSLNSEDCKSANSFCAPGSPQYEWLKADLAANPHACSLAYWHRPRYSSGYHGGSSRMATITELLYGHGADVVLAGHDHAYERFARVDPAGQPDEVRGIRHFVIGTGGAGLYRLEHPALPITETRQADVHGVLRLDLRPGAYDWSFVPTVEGIYADSGSGTCH